MSEPSSTTWAAVGRYAREVARCYIREWYRHSFRRWWRRRWVTRRLRHPAVCLCAHCNAPRDGAPIPVRTPLEEGWSPTTTFGEVARSRYPQAVQEYFRTDPDELARVYRAQAAQRRGDFGQASGPAGAAAPDQYAQLRRTMTDPVALAALDELSRLANDRTGQQQVAVVRDQIAAALAERRWTDLT